MITGILWSLAPSLACYISKEIKEKREYEKIGKEEKSYISDVGVRTWNFFKDYINEETNFLPPDNYQESREEKIVLRTSSTNIGLRTSKCYICI